MPLLPPSPTSLGKAPERSPIVCSGPFLSGSPNRKKLQAEPAASFPIFPIRSELLTVLGRRAIGIGFGFGIGLGLIGRRYDHRRALLHRIGHLGRNSGLVEQRDGEQIGRTVQLLDLAGQTTVV